MRLRRFTVLLTLLAGSFAFAGTARAQGDGASGDEDGKPKESEETWTRCSGALLEQGGRRDLVGHRVHYQVSERGQVLRGEGVVIEQDALSLRVWKPDSEIVTLNHRKQRFDSVWTAPLAADVIPFHSLEELKELLRAQVLQDHVAWISLPLQARPLAPEQTPESDFHVLPAKLRLSVSGATGEELELAFALDPRFTLRLPLDYLEPFEKFFPLSGFFLPEPLFRSRADIRKLANARQSRAFLFDPADSLEFFQSDRIRPFLREEPAEAEHSLSPAESLLLLLEIRKSALSGPASEFAREHMGESLVNDLVDGMTLAHSQQLQQILSLFQLWKRSAARIAASYDASKAREGEAIQSMLFELERSFLRKNFKLFDQERVLQRMFVTPRGERFYFSTPASGLISHAFILHQNNVVLRAVDFDATGRSTVPLTQKGRAYVFQLASVEKIGERLFWEVEFVGNALGRNLY